RHELSGTRQQQLHQRRPRRPGACGLCHPRCNPPGVPVASAACRRPRPARRHAGRDDARGRRALGFLMAKDKTGRLHVTVRTAGKRKLSSKLWLERQLNDPYVAQAKREGYRSRAAFKLIEIDDKYRLLKPGMTVVDLGAAPGGWSQIAAKRVGAAEGKGSDKGKGKGEGGVIAIDLLEMPEIPGVRFAQL